MSCPFVGASLRVALLLLVSILVFAPGASPAAQEPGQETVTPAGRTAGEGMRQDRITALDGATITWNAAARRFEAPSPEQAARLAADLRRLVAAKATAPGFRRLAQPGEHDEVVLPGGVRRVRLGVEHLNFSIVRLDDEGRLVQSCADGIAEAAEQLVTPVSDPVQER